MTDETNEFAAEGDYEPSGRNTIVIGFALLLIGFAAGAIAAALMTPKTGKQMRRGLRRKLEDARETVEDWRENAKDVREKAAGLADKAQQWADAAKDAVGPFAKKIRS